VVQRFSADGVPHDIHAYFPASGTEFFARLRHACLFHERTELIEVPVAANGPVAEGEFGVLEAKRLDHSVDAIGYRLVEPDSRRFVPDLLDRHHIAGPAVGQLQRAGSLRVGDRTVTMSDVSTPRRGQRFAFIMDTRLCDAVYALADGVDLLVIEATFLDADAELAAQYGHLTARQAARVAEECGVRRLVLTHFSQRYPDLAGHRDEAAEVFGGDLVVAQDLMRIPVPKRR
jgi:ribonuclease Z